MNRVVIIGNLTKDPDLRTTANTGTSVCTFTVAVSRRFASQNGEREADFIPVVVWRGQADSCARYLRKGSQVGVSGSIQTRSYDDQNGNRRYVTEVVADEVQFLARTVGSDDNNNNRQGGNRSFQKPAGQQRPAKPVNNTPQEIEDDDLPF